MTYINDALRGKKVLVTGATGFVGAHLAERLAVEEGAVVTGTGRDLAKAAHLQEIGVQLLKADLLDEEAMAAAVAGQEVIFHVAAWLRRHGGTDAEVYALNVTATENLVRLAAAAGVHRFVHVSSIAAYGVPNELKVYEDHPLDVEQGVRYGRSKAIGEIKAKALAEELGLPLTIARPALVYGPKSSGWTLNMLRMVQRGVPVLYGDARGFAYPVYIDNLVDGFLRQAVRPQAVGEAFNFCDEAIDWPAFFGYYSRMCGKKARRIPIFLTHFIIWLNGIFDLRLPLNRDYLRQYQLQIEYPIAKAAQLLDYEPRVSVDEGMRRTELWLRAAGHLSAT